MISWALGYPSGEAAGRYPPEVPSGTEWGLVGKRCVGKGLGLGLGLSSAAPLPARLAAASQEEGGSFRQPECLSSVPSWVPLSSSRSLLK